MKLWELNEEQSAEIRGFDDGLSPAYTQRLKELGFVVGAPIKCIKKTPFRAPRVFEVSGGVFTLEKEAASYIQISPLQK